MTKRELIKEAYKKYFNESDVDHRMHISFNGWSDKLNLELINDDEFLKELDIRQTTFRPKSLQGIEDNNGWIKIESEDDLPKDYVECYFITKYDKDEFRRGFFCNKSKNFYENYSHSFIDTTHYQPIVKPKPPIY